MKKYLFIIYLLFAFTQLTAQDITGSWEGTLSTSGQQLRFVFHIKSVGGQYTTSFDVPAQNAKELHTEKTTVQKDSVLIDIALLKGGYYGRWDGKDQITGTYKQGQLLAPLMLGRMSGAIAEPEPKPQTPKPPFNYIVEEVAYENTTQQVPLGGTFTRPAGNGKFPAVLLITGSGPQDRNERIGEHKPFWLIADQLTKQGFAVLRVDDRSIGKSGGNFGTSSSADFATDVMAGIAYLKGRPDVDATKIGLLGHSEGGIIAAYVAARTKDVAFIVSLAGSAVNGAAINDFQNTEPLKRAGVPQYMIDSFLVLHHASRDAALNTASDSLYRAAIRKTFLDWKSRQTTVTQQTLIHGSDEAAIGTQQKAYAGFRAPWWRFFLSYDPVPDIAKLSIPVLALNGGKDAQVEPKANLAAWGEGLKKSKSPKYKTLEIEGLNHLFQHCVNCASVEEYMRLSETFDPATLQIISDWLKSVVF
jgi:pimeloyl-ACP methyl ester carboxylesterase